MAVFDARSPRKDLLLEVKTGRTVAIVLLGASGRVGGGIRGAGDGEGFLSL